MVLLSPQRAWEHYNLKNIVIFDLTLLAILNIFTTLPHCKLWNLLHKLTFHNLKAICDEKSRANFAEWEAFKSVLESNMV